MNFAASRLPSAQTIALAISVVRSKPEDLQLRDYLDYLRRHFANGRRADRLSSNFGHLDTSSFWRSEAERIKQKLDAVENEKLVLKRELDELKANSAVSEPRCRMKKRKGPSGDFIGPMPASKRSKAGDLSSKPMTARKNLQTGSEFSYLGEAGDVLLLHLYYIRKSISHGEGDFSITTSYHVAQACSAIPTIVEQAFRASTDQSYAKAADLPKILGALTRAVSILFTACSRNKQDDAISERYERDIYALVQMFSKVLSAMNLFSPSHVKSVDTAEPLSTNIFSQAGSRRRTRRSAAGDRKVETALDNFTSFVSTMFEMLDAGSEAHRSLFEGFSYFVIEHVGSRLFKSVFGHARGKTMDEEIALGVGSNEPSESTTVDLQNSGDTLMEPIDKGILCLVQLTSKVLILAPAFLNQDADADEGLQSGVDNEVSNKSSLTVMALQRLQKTLVNCIFGTEGMEDDDRFADCLKVPLPPKIELRPPAIGQLDVNEWFQLEIWQLIGWQILAQGSG